MKKVILILTFALFLGNLLNAQTKQGQITYRLNMDKLYLKDGEPTLDNKSNQINKLIAKSAQNIELELIFENRKSFFNERKKMEVGDKLEDNLKIMARAFSYSGNRLTDLDKNIQLLVRDYEGKLIYVEKPFKKREWELSTETKKIAGFNCYKATYVKKVPKGDFLITAWYTPEISSQFGPVEYCGELPGLILELHDIVAIYTCVSVKLNIKNPITLNWPDEKEIMSEEQYKKEGDKIGKITRG